MKRKQSNPSVDLNWKVVTIAVTLLGATVSVFAINDRYVTIREWRQALESIDQRLSNIESRLNQIPVSPAR